MPASDTATGWSFDTDGRLVTVPGWRRRGFRQGAFGLASAPRVSDIVALCFKSRLKIWFRRSIGPVKTTSTSGRRAPDGELALDAMHPMPSTAIGSYRSRMSDLYHVPFGHASTVNKDGGTACREGDVRTVVETERATAASWKDRKSFIAGNGHG